MNRCLDNKKMWSHNTETGFPQNDGAAARTGTGLKQKNRWCYKLVAGYYLHYKSIKSLKLVITIHCLIVTVIWRLLWHCIIILFDAIWQVPPV